MEFINIALLIWILFCVSDISKIKKKLQSLNKKDGGVKRMSKIIEKLVGSNCELFNDDGMAIIKGTITEYDEEWVRVESIDKKNTNKVQIIRIEDINKIEVL